MKSSIYDYLVWEPTGQLKDIADSLDRLESDRSELYRGTTTAELATLYKTGTVTSKGSGNTRDILGSYLASDIKLAARFALVSQRDKGNGVILVLARSKLPRDLKAVDPGNFVVSSIPKLSLKRAIILKDLKILEDYSRFSPGSLYAQVLETIK